MKYIVKPAKRKLVGLALTAIIGIALGAPVNASAGHNHYLTLAAAATSKSAAADKARAMYGGKVLKVEEVSNGAGKVYRVKLLLEGGRIKIVTIDANSGRAT